MHHRIRAVMVHDNFEQDDPVAKVRQDWEAGLNQQTRVGWPTVAATGTVTVIGVLLTVYLKLEACVGR